jgi:hypothetical protein
VRIAVLERPVAAPSGTPLLIETLRELGHDAEPVNDRDFVPDTSTTVLVHGSPTWFPASMRALLGSGARPPVVVWQSEPLRVAGMPRELLTARDVAKIVLRDPRRSDPASNLRSLVALHRAGRLTRVAVCAAAWQEPLASAGIEADVVPLGYAPLHGRLLGLERDIDVLFLGALDLRYRRRVFARLRRDGLDVHAVGSWSDPAYWGENRVRLINRAKVLLNVPRSPGQLPAQRLILGMANGALVVSDTIVRPEPFVPGEHYVEAPVVELAATAQRWLADDDGRARMTAHAHSFVTQELTFARSLAQLLEPARS